MRANQQSEKRKHVFPHWHFLCVLRIRCGFLSVVRHTVLLLMWSPSLGTPCRALPSAEKGFEFLACLEAQVPLVIWDLLQETFSCRGSIWEVKKLHRANDPFISVDRMLLNLDLGHMLGFCVVFCSHALSKGSFILSGSNWFVEEGQFV